MYFVRVGLKFMVEMDAESTKVIVEKYYDPSEQKLGPTGLTNLDLELTSSSENAGGMKWRIIYSALLYSGLQTVF